MASIQDHAEDMAAEAMGNWRKFESFGWSSDAKPADAERWAIVYTHNRDSGLVEQSNASVIDERMAPFCEGDDPDCQAESHNHWACGWVDGYAIRVRDAEGNVTPAWLAWCELQCKLADYPLLSEDDHSRREYEAALDAIVAEGRRFVSKETPSWPSDVFGWLWENDQAQVENRDDQGACPDRDAVETALIALGYADPQDDDD